MVERQCGWRRQRPRRKRRSSGCRSSQLREQVCDRTRFLILSRQKSQRIEVSESNKLAWLHVVNVASFSFRCADSPKASVRPVANSAGAGPRSPTSTLWYVPPYRGHTLKYPHYLPLSRDHARVAGPRQVGVAHLTPVPPPPLLLPVPPYYIAAFPLDNLQQSALFLDPRSMKHSDNNKHTPDKMMSFAPAPIFSWDHRPAVPSPLSSSPVRASSPLSPIDRNTLPQRQIQSSPIQQPKFKYSSRQTRPNPVVRKREEVQESRRKLFLQNVRQKSDEKSWQRRDIEGQVRSSQINSNDQ